MGKVYITHLQVIFIDFTTMFRSHQGLKKYPNGLGWFDGVSVSCFGEVMKFYVMGLILFMFKNMLFKIRDLNEYFVPLIMY